MTDPQNLPTAYNYDTLNRLSTLAFNGQTPAFGFGYDSLSLAHFGGLAHP